MHIVVLGGGPGGYSAAFEAARLGAEVTLVERERLGGTCLNWGCIPTKTILRSARIVADTRDAATFGLNAAVATAGHRRTARAQGGRGRRARGTGRVDGQAAEGPHRLRRGQARRARSRSRSHSPMARPRPSKATRSSSLPARRSSSCRASTTSSRASGRATRRSRSSRSPSTSSSSAAVSSGWSSRARTRRSAAWSPSSSSWTRCCRATTSAW